MTPTKLTPDTVRFLRTLQIATASTLAAADLAGATRARAATTFLALAAKGRDDWRFPASGLTSADSLVRATLVDEGNGKTLILQALGAAGLVRYAGANVALTLASGIELAGRFNRDGALALPLGDAGVAEIDLAGFDIDFVGDAT